MFAGVLVYAGSKIGPVVTDHVREYRIKQLYASLNLDATYLPQASNIFGDKRIASPGRTQASSVTFVRGASVNETLSDLKHRVETAGFSFLQQEYPGSASPVDEFKDSKGEYVRISASSKPRDDAILDKALMRETPNPSDYDMDLNAGPSNVTIKVNLDDNNE
jgi:hypothetical protein